MDWLNAELIEAVGRHLSWKLIMLVLGVAGLVAWGKRPPKPYCTKCHGKQGDR